MSYRMLADIVVAIHVGYVACVVFGLLLILAGGALGWTWVHNRWVRGIHLAMIVLVVARSAVWRECPLTTWETDLRALAGQTDFEAWSISYVLHVIIHPPHVPMWVFPIVYVLFAGLIVATLWFVPVAWRPSSVGWLESSRPTKPNGGSRKASTHPTNLSGDPPCIDSP